MSKRLQEIEGAIKKLEEFERNPVYADRLYAIKENIIFLKAARSLPAYIKWLLTRTGKLDGSKLLELTDFPVPEWDRKMHWRLIEMQKRDNPGLVKPLVEAIVDFVKKENRDLICANLGAGGMEVDRQVIRRLIDSSYNKRLVIVAVDKSETTREIAKENLASLNSEIELIEVDQLTLEQLEETKQKTNKNIVVFLCKNDIFELDKTFPAKYFDLVYHSLFKHHLDDKQKRELDRVLDDLSNTILEYDGYLNKSVIVLQTIVGWNYPNFLNAELFSNFRFKEKDFVLSYAKERGDINFYSGLGQYLLKIKL